MQVRSPGARSSARDLEFSAAGFTLFELVVVISVAGLIAVIAAGRFLYWEERAEKAAMDLMLAEIKLGLQVRLAEMLMTNQQSQAAVLETQNPLRWLENPPANYAGDYAPPVRPGYWYYAAKEHALVYLPNNSAYLDLEQPGGKELWFRIVVRYETNSVTGGRIPAGIGLVPAREFKWF
jgi:prepilin-type N-terminal cleavage/methylation domain-containing protein